MDGIIHITTEAIITDIATKGITISIRIAGTITGIAVGWSALVGVQDITAIGKRVARSALTDHRNRAHAMRSNVLRDFDSERSVCRNWA
jgi:hypothetical protein